MFNMIRRGLISAQTLAERLYSINNAFTDYHVSTNMRYPGGKKIAMLDNGDIIAVVPAEGSSTRLNIYKFSKSNYNAAPTLLAYVTDCMTASYTYALCVSGNICTLIYWGYPNDQGRSYQVVAVRCDITTCSNTDLTDSSISIDPDITTNSVTQENSMCIAADSTGKVYVAYHGMFSSYPNSTNIRFLYSTDGINWTRSYGPVTYNTSGMGAFYPVLCVRNDDVPVLFFTYDNSPTSSILYSCLPTLGSTLYTVHNAGTYRIWAGSCCIAPNGLAYVSWYGTFSGYPDGRNIGCAVSGNSSCNTWTSTRITSETTMDYTYSENDIIVDINNDAYVLAVRAGNRIYLIKRVSGSWQSPAVYYTPSPSAALFSFSAINKHLAITDPIIIVNSWGEECVKIIGSYTG